MAAVIFAGTLWLYSSLPAEYLPAFFDPGWYLNTGALVARTGGLAFDSEPFSALPPDLRWLFFSSFSSMRLDFPQLPESGSRGFFLTAFAVPSVEDGTVSPYHPPLLSVWLALFYAFGGLRAALYVPALFGALSVMGVFLAGRALFGRGPGLLAALLLAVCLPQVYYSRTPYAEVLLQFLVLAGLYALTALASGAGRAHAALAGLAFGQALLTKIEAVLLLIPLAIFWTVRLARKRSGFQEILAFGLPFGGLASQALLLALTVNRVYVALNGYGLWSRLGLALAQPILWLGSLVTVVAVALWLLRRRWSLRAWLAVGDWLTQAPSPVMRRAVAWAVLLLAAYSFFIHPWVGSVLSDGLTGSDASGLVQVGRFLSPWGLWLGLVGLVLLLDRGYDQQHLFFVALVLTVCSIVLAAPTISTMVSPLYAVRRQVPVVIPGLLLLASYCVLSGWRLVLGSPLTTQRREARGLGVPTEGLRPYGMRAAQMLATLVLVVGLLGVARPYLRYREMRGTIAFVERLAGSFSQDALVLFEPVSVESDVGRFAAPLWAVHGVNSLVLSPLASFSGDMDKALALLASRYESVYWVSASPRQPLAASSFEADLVGEEMWESSAIPPDPTYPPRVEFVEMTFYIFAIRPK